MLRVPLGHRRVATMMIDAHSLTRAGRGGAAG
jgi:hypothetical protein